MYLDGLTYTGSDGRIIVRPPGLTDLPGSAATAGALTAILGLGLLLRRRQPAQVLAILGAVTVGFAAIYLSQVRSTLLATIGASGLLAIVAFWRGRFASAGWLLLAGGADCHWLLRLGCVGRRHVGDRPLRQPPGLWSNRRVSQ